MLTHPRVGVSRLLDIDEPKSDADMTISVLIPTYSRPHDLRRCFAALREQHIPPNEVLVVYRKDDHKTLTVIHEFSNLLPLRAVQVDLTGAVHAYNAGLDQVSGDVIAITDDDAKPHADWLKRISAHFAADAKLGGVGGRDIVYEHGEPIPASEPIVGKIQFFGRMIGNHHIGVGPPRRVEVLKGANMSFRLSAIGAHRFDSRLWGNGAQVHLEVGMCSAVLKQGWNIVYDPAVLVDHFPAKRHDEDQRSSFSSLAQVNSSHNETLALLDYLSWLQRPLFLAWCLLVGTSSTPGILQAIRLKGRGNSQVSGLLMATLKGRMLGLRTWLRSNGVVSRMADRTP